MSDEDLRRIGTLEIQDLDSLETERRFYHMPVPIFEMTKNTYQVNLVKTEKIDNPRPFFARGTLIGNYDSDFKLEDKPLETDFVGNFEGTFEKEADSPDYYFEGKIYNLQFM